MEDKSKNLFLFGDYTASWIESLDGLSKQALSTPWLNEYLKDITKIYRDEVQHVEPFLRNSLGPLSELKSIADRYRHSVDEISFAQGLGMFAVQSAILLLWVKGDPNLSGQAQVFGVSGGLINASVLAVAQDFDNLYMASLETARVFVRSCRLAIVKSRAIEDGPGSWGCVYVGIPAQELRGVLVEFQQQMRIPAAKWAKIGLVGEKWTTVIGPPSVLTLISQHCPQVRDIPKNDVNIHALQHAMQLSDTELDYIVGNSQLATQPIRPSFQFWGMKQPNATYQNWGEFIKAVMKQALADELNVVRITSDFESSLGAVSEVKIKNMGINGPTSHAVYLKSKLQAMNRHVIYDNMQFTSLDADGTYMKNKIAIVGMAGKGPGCDNLEQFWDIIQSAKDLHQAIPTDRFQLQDYDDANSKVRGRCDTRKMAKFGCFIDKAGEFDARFFNISPREALLMDPCHRLFLMTAYEALESAGYAKKKTASDTTTTDEERVSVFFGQCNDDWRTSSHDVKGCDPYTLTGTARPFGPGRLAFHFGWEGPTYSIDAACSSSASSVHLACMSLLSGDVDTAVAGAANVTGYPHTWISLSQSGVLSPTGNCKPFRDDADGYCRADFSGVIVLKRLQDAVDANDNILAVIRSTGRNQSGNASSITTSDATAQKQLFDRVLSQAFVSPQDVDYVEMHGTGTQVGDPAEMRAVVDTFGHGDRKSMLRVGAVKGNVGHSEAAAGIASILKSVLMLQHNQIPPQVGMPNKLNRNFPNLSESKIEIPCRAYNFVPTAGQTRRIVVNNFDAAGGNSCLLLEDYHTTIQPPSTKEKQDDGSSSCQIIVTSAKTEESLQANKRNLLWWLQQNSEAKIRDIAYSTTARRCHLPIRFACTATSVDELQMRLKESIGLNSEKPTPASSTKRPIVFMFSGQGAQYPGNVANLYHNNRPFRDTVNLCCSLSLSHGFPEFKNYLVNPREMTSDSSADTIQLHLALLTLEIALAAMWKGFGVVPDAVLGHSIGEYAALHVAGVLSLSDALYLIGTRAKLLQDSCDDGSCAMLAVNESADTVELLLRTDPESESQDFCEVACTNGPKSTVVSGTHTCIQMLQNKMTTAGITCRQLPLRYGFHSRQMDLILSDLGNVAETVLFNKPRTCFISTLFGTSINCDADIWESRPPINANYIMQQTRRKVNFSGAVVAAEAQFKDDPIWIELGPGRVCTSLVSSNLPAFNSLTSVASLAKLGNHPGQDWESVCIAVARVYEWGVDLDWKSFHRSLNQTARFVPLPSYAWTMKDFWIPYQEVWHRDSGASGVPSLSVDAPKEFITTCAQYVKNKSRRVSGQLSIILGADTREPGLKTLVDGHRLLGVPVCTGSAFIEAALSAAMYITNGGGQTRSHVAKRFKLEAMNLKRAITERDMEAGSELITEATSSLPVNDTVNISFALSPGGAGDIHVGTCKVKLNSLGASQMLTDSSMLSHSFFIKSRLDQVVAEASQGQGQGHRMRGSIFYSLFSNTVEYDAAFRATKEAFFTENFQEGVAKVLLHADPPKTSFTVSPYWCDGLLQLVGFIVNGNPDRPKDVTYMMSSFESYEQFYPLEAGIPYSTYVRVTYRDDKLVHCDTFAFSGSRLVVQCLKCIFHSVTNKVLSHLLVKMKPTSPTLPVKRQHSSQTMTADQLEEIKGSEAQQLPVNTEQDSHTGTIRAESIQKKSMAHQDIFAVILTNIVQATGTDKTDISDKSSFAELGVDSIMAIEISTAVSEKTGSHFPASFISDYSTIGELRRSFAITTKYSSSDSDATPTTGQISPQSTATEMIPETVAISHAVSSILKENAEHDQRHVPDTKCETLNTPSTAFGGANPATCASKSSIDVKISLMQRRNALNPSRNFYMIADGTGSIATYIYLPPLRSTYSIYGIESPYFRCPEQLLIDGGIPTMAKKIAEAIADHCRHGPLFVGGFSGGAMISYEICRQLSVLGRKVQGMLLVDMCCPRTVSSQNDMGSLREMDMEVFDTISAHLEGPIGHQHSKTHQHLKAMFDAVATYHPSYLSEEEKPQKVAIIWAQKGVIERCKENSEVMKLLSKHGLLDSSSASFMQDSRFGSICWSLPNKTSKELGMNGWERYLGVEALCASVSSDHLEMMSSSKVSLVREAIEHALEYIS